MYLKIFTLAALSTLAADPAYSQQKMNENLDMLYHYSVMDAMRNGVYKADLSISQATEKGDFGLGTYHQLDGELLALDGVFYRIAPDGKVLIAEADRQVPFAALVFFKADSSFTLQGIKDINALQAEIARKLPSANKPYAIRISVIFSKLMTGGANKQSDKDTVGLGELMKTRPLYEKKNVKGTLIGFYNPPFISGVDLSPFHFHFLSDDQSYGGHLVSGTLSEDQSIKVEWDGKAGYHIVLPEKNQRFDKAWKSNAGTSSSY